MIVGTQSVQSANGFGLRISRFAHPTPSLKVL